MSRISLLAGVLCAALAMLSTAQAQTVPARASMFLGSLGVNTHLGDLDTSWGNGPGTWAPNETKVLAELNYLGFPNIRDSVPQGSLTSVEMNDIAKQGFHFDLLQVDDSGVPRIAADVAQIAAQMQAVPGSVISAEASNEYNGNDYTLGGVASRNNLAWGAIVDKATQAALKANTVTAGLSLVAASTTNVSSAPAIGGYADRANWHVYSNLGQHLAAGLKQMIAAAQATLPGKPVDITETGISSGAASISTWGNAGDEYTQGLIDTAGVLDAFNDGAAHTYLYDLMDETTSTTSIESMFGLFHTDGTAKAAATDLHNLTTILADSGATAASFTPSAPGFALPTLPAGASAMLLQKASGAWDLVLWNSSLPVWSGTAEVTPTPATVTMPLSGTYSSVKVYDVVTGATPTQTLANVSSVSLTLGKEPQVIEIAGLVPPVVTPTGCAAAATDTLRITTSEDAYQGDAQFTVAVDGKQVGGTYSATASHAAGQTSDLVLTGTWGTGPHTVAISFLNDLWGGSAAQDRNLYVSAVKLDGVPSATPAQELPWVMTATWAVGQ